MLSKFLGLERGAYWWGRLIERGLKIIYGVCMFQNLERRWNGTTASPCKLGLNILHCLLPDINSACQRCIAKKGQRKSYLSANWVRTKSVYQQIGVAHLTNNFH